MLIGILLLCSLPLIRRFAYEIFLRTHQSLAIVSIYAIWRHLPSDSLSLKIYVYVPLGMLLLISFLQVLRFLYYNGILPSRPYPRALVTCTKVEPSDKQNEANYSFEGRPITIRVVLPRKLKVNAGQYVNLCLPSLGLGLGSWMQTHPYMVTSWSPQKQDTLELFAQTRRGLTARLRACAALEGSASFSAFISCPHGISRPVSKYECVLVVATGFGIAGVISNIKKLLHGYNTSTSRVRRMHFVWQVKSLGEPANFPSLATGQKANVSRYCDCGSVVTQ